MKPGYTPLFKPCKALALFMASVCFPFLGTGCTSIHPKTGFLTLTTQLHQGKYFKQENVLPGRDFAQFRKVKVSLVDVSFLPEDGGYDRNEVRMLRDSLQGALEGYLRQAFLVVGREAEPDSETLIIRPALVHLMPPARNVQVGAEWKGTGLPVATGGAAFEAKFLEPGTGHLLAEVAERRSDGQSLGAVTVDAYNRYENVEAVFEVWGEQLLGFVKDLRAQGRDFSLGSAGLLPELLVQDFKAIESLQRQWMDEELRGNKEGLVGLCTDDVQWIPPDAPAVLGKDALRDWLKAREIQSASIQITDTDTGGSGSVAYLTSRYSKVLVPEGGFLAHTVTGTHFWVLKKTPDKGWRVAVAGWNQNGPPANLQV